MLGVGPLFAGIYSTAMLAEHERQLAVMLRRKQKYMEEEVDFMSRQAKVANIGSSKCQSCHSREFRQYHGGRVCSYCRSEG